MQDDTRPSPPPADVPASQVTPDPAAPRLRRHIDCAIEAAAAAPPTPDRSVADRAPGRGRGSARWTPGAAGERGDRGRE